MTSNFEFDGKIVKLQVDQLKPAMVARRLRLDENSLVLTDAEGYCYMPEDGAFEPKLKSGQNYIVDGIVLAGGTAEEIDEKRLVMKELNDELKVIQGSAQNDLTAGVIETCKDMNESANMLYHGPQAALLVQTLAILSVCAPDPTLDIATLNKEQRNRLADPGSFRASLLHVANKMCNAFRQADYSMKKVRACLIDLPDYFEATLEVTGQHNDEKSKIILSRTIRQIEKSSETCNQEATNAKNAFDDVIKDIDALCVAATSSKTVSEREKVELKKLKDEMDIKAEQLKQEEKQLKEEYEEAQKQAKEALKEYRTQMDKSTSLGKLFLATLTDGVFDVIKAGVSAPKDLITGAAQALNHFGRETVACSNMMKYAVETSLIQSLEKIASSLENPQELDEDTVSDYIITLKDFQKYSPATKEGAALFKKAKETQTFFEKHRNDLKNVEQNRQIKNEIAAMKTSLQNIVVTVVQAQENAKAETVSKNSLREKMLQADRDRVSSAQQHFTAAEVKAEARRKEVAENRRELTDMICKIKSIDTTTVELTEIIEYLRQGVFYLGKVKTNWTVLADFFTNIQIIVEENLTNNINTFIEEAKNPVSHKLMLQGALKATGYCIQVSNVASIYTAVSQRFIMPVISGVGEQLALTPAQARQKQQQLDFTQMDEGVKKLIEEKQEEFQARVTQQMQNHARNITKAVKVGNIASTKAIKN